MTALIVKGTSQELLIESLQDSFVMDSFLSHIFMWSYSSLTHAKGQSNQCKVMNYRAFNISSMILRDNHLESSS